MLCTPTTSPTMRRRSQPALHDAMRDWRLSWAARGMLAYFRSHPRRRRFSVSEMCCYRRVGAESTELVRASLKQLVTYGYVDIDRGVIEVSHGDD